MTRRGFYVFNIDTPHDEAMALAALQTEGIAGAEVMARERDEKRIYVEYEHEKPMPIDIRERLQSRGITV